MKKGGMMDNNYVYVDMGNCKKCGKPFVYIGDIPSVGFLKGFEPYCTCGFDYPKHTEDYGNYGWICPICKKVLAPWVRQCDGYHGQDSITTTFSNF
jgi:hypothetical protein